MPWAQRVHQFLQIRRPAGSPRSGLVGAARAQHPMAIGPCRDGESPGSGVSPSRQARSRSPAPSKSEFDAAIGIRAGPRRALRGAAGHGSPIPSAWRGRRCRDRPPSTPPPAPASRPRRHVPAAPAGTPARRHGHGRPARRGVFCSRILRSCAFSTSLAVRACRYVMPPAAVGAGRPCSRSVSATAPTAASGTGRKVDRCRPRCIDGSVACARRASRSRSVDRAVGVQHQPPRRPRLLHRAARDAGVCSILALAHAGAITVRRSP